MKLQAGKIWSKKIILNTRIYCRESRRLLFVYRKIRPAKSFGGKAQAGEQKGRGTGGVKAEIYFTDRIWNPVTDEISLTAVPDIDIYFEDLKKIPPHLINLLRDQAIIFSNGGGGNWAQDFWRWLELSQKYQKKVSDIPADIYSSGCVYSPYSPYGCIYIPSGCVYIPEDLFGYRDNTYRCPKDIFLSSVSNLIHEFGHIVDSNGIRMYKGREFALDKIDEGIRELYNEFRRVFRLTSEMERCKNATGIVLGFLLPFKALEADYENFAVHFEQYIHNPQYFRERMVNEPALLEKYEFLKTKIFLGQEYQGSPPSWAWMSTPTQLDQCQIKN